MDRSEGDKPKVGAERTVHGAATVDTARFPIIDVTYAGTVAPEDYASAFARFAEIARAGEPLVWLIDMRRFDPLKVDAVVRKGAAAVFQRHRDVLMRVSIAEARVVHGFLTRNVLTAFDWLTGANKWPCQQHATMSLAEHWLGERYREKTGKSLGETQRSGVRLVK